ncbi:MAG: glycosyltransferase [Winogradskyella sp.]
MRVLQLIDSLNIGGSERVAVNFANALVDKVEVSYLCATRNEGLLKSFIEKDVRYKYLNKKHSIDFKALLRLRNFIKTEGIDIVHAHSSSFFLSVLVKLTYPKLKIVWHDHFGKPVNKKPSLILKFFSYFFHHILVVNESLMIWAQKHLFQKNITMLPNYAELSNTAALTTLNGVDDHRIICIANFRPEKDHLNLIRAFDLIQKKYPNWTLHCVGKMYEDCYLHDIKNLISERNLEESVFLYDLRPDIKNILLQSDISVLSSKSEGLPLALLEYGLAGLPAVVTDVGDSNKIIVSNETGLLVPSMDYLSFSEALDILISKPILRKQLAENLNYFVLNNYGKQVTISKLVEVYKSIQ